MKVSLITATYNSATVVDACMLSVAEQLHDRIEHIIIDGASTDETIGLLKNYRPAVAKIVSEPDNGIYDALNKGIALASGEVIGFLNSDDMFASPEVLKNICSIFEADDTVSAVYGDLVYIKKSKPDRIIRTWRSSQFFPELLKKGWMPPHPTLYVRREWYGHIGGFDTSYRISADYLSILQLFSQENFKPVYLPEVMIKMRLGGASNRSLCAVLRKSTEDWIALRRSGFGLLGSTRTLVVKNLCKIKQFF